MILEPGSPYPTDAEPSAEHVEQQLFRGLVVNVRDYAVISLTPSGHIASWSTGAEHITGYSAKEIVGQPLSRFYPQEALARQSPQTELRVAAERGGVQDAGWLVRKDGSQFWADVVITTVYDDAGGVAGYLEILRDLTERCREEERLRQSEERLRLLIENVSDHAIFMLDPRGNVTSWNAGAQRMKGYAAAEIIGQHFSRFYPSEANAQGWPEHELKVAIEKNRFEDEGWRVRKDGSRFWANVVITPVYDSKRTLRGFAKVTRDLTETKRMIALQTSERHMDEFLAMLGHELRNPIGALRNAAVIVKKFGETSEIGYASRVLDRQLSQLSRLLDDLLDVTRIRQGRIHVRPVRVTLAQVVQRAVETVTPLMQQKGHRLSMRFSSEQLAVEGDSERLIQVFVNVLNNAAKYTPPGGSVDIVTERDQDNVLVRIKDSGVGIEPELLPHIFEIFRQGDLALDRTEGGLGIGLTLAQRIVELHRGSLQAFSRGLDQGSEFIVRLPLATGDQHSAPVAVEKVALPAARRDRILLVEDSRDAADTLAMNLRMEGYSVDVAYNGAEALHLFSIHRHPAALVDIGLPGITGYDLCRALRARAVSRPLLTIALTGYGQASDKEKSLAAGFDYHLVKPVVFADLLEVLSRSAGRVAC